MDHTLAAPPAGVKLIVGLGNPGERYRETRHNLGFRAVQEVARRQGIPLDCLECNSLVGETEGLLLALPQTYMNRSGYAVRCLVERRSLSPGLLLVVYDDVSLPLGRIRIRKRGSPGGHRGMESVVESLRTDEIPRLRLGIGRGEETPTGEDLVDFVLSPFDADEREEAERLVQRAADACQVWWQAGTEEAMNRFNG